MIHLEGLDLSIDKKEHIIRLSKNLKNIHLDFEYESDFRNAKELRDFVGAIADIVGMPEMWKMRFILVTDEMNNNAIEYGSRPEDRNRITFKVIKRKLHIKMVVEVEDSGLGKSPKKAEEMYALQEKNLKEGFDNHKGIRGRGLFLITQRTVDKLYFKNSPKGGLIVGVEKEIDLEPEDVK